MKLAARTLCLMIVMLGLSTPAVAETLAQPKISICSPGQSALFQDRLSYRVTVNWNGYRWQRSERVDIGIFDKNDELWPQLREYSGSHFRNGQATSQVDIVVAPSSQFPLLFGLVKFSEEVWRLSDSECSLKGMCSVPSDYPGVTLLIPQADQVLVAGPREVRKC